MSNSFCIQYRQLKLTNVLKLKLNDTQVMEVQPWYIGISNTEWATESLDIIHITPAERIQLLLKCTEHFSPFSLNLTSALIHIMVHMGF